MNVRSRPLIDAALYANICSLCALTSRLFSVSVWAARLGTRSVGEDVCLKDEGERVAGACL
jgi:hypothetical protein